MSNLKSDPSAITVLVEKNSSPISSKGSIGSGKHATDEDYGKLANFIEHEPKQNEYSLFHAPFVRQFFAGSVLHRSPEHRKVSWDELFFDLIFVICIATVGHTLRYDATWETFYHFWILFYPIWSTWKDVSFYINLYGTDDLFIRLFGIINVTMAIFMSLTASNVFPHSKGAPSTFYLYLGCFIISRWVVFVGHMVHAIYFRKLRFTIGMLALSTVIPNIFFLASNYGPEENRLQFFWVGLALDIILFNLQGFIYYFGKVKYRFAVNIEHFVERVGLFTIIVLGETIAALNVIEVNSTTVTKLFLAVFFGLIIAVSLQDIYFKTQASKHYLHAIRRGILHGSFWNVLHLLLHGCLVIGSGGLYSFLYAIASEEYSMKKVHHITLMERYNFMGFFGVSLLITTIMGLLHKNLDHEKGYLTVFPKNVMIGSRSIISLILIIVGFALPLDNLNALEYVVLTACLIFYQSIFERYGGLRKKAKGEKFDKEVNELTGQ